MNRSRQLEGAPRKHKLTTAMAYITPSRTVLHAISATLSIFLLSPLLAQPASGPPHAVLAPRSVSPARTPKPQQQEHLAQWMDRHSNLPPDQQKTALESEPGFRDLPQQTQQRMQDRLTQLNSMPPEQRRRLLERTEAMEKLSPAQRQQVRGAMQQLTNLPIDRRRLVARAFRDIREMPVPQRQAILNSDRFRAQFSDQERGTLSNLLTVEPYLPVQQRPTEAPEYGK